MALPLTRRAFVVIALAIFANSGCEERSPANAPPKEAASTATIYVVRHAQAVKNVKHPDNLTEEQLDALTPDGKKQAEELAKYLKTRGAAAVILSPTGRTRETAAAIGQALGVAPVETTSLVGLAKGESYEAGAKRASAAIESLARAGKPLVVVTHGDVVATLLGQAAGTPPLERWTKHQVPEGSVSELAFEDGRYRLVSSGVQPKN